MKNFNIVIVYIFLVTVTTSFSVHGESIENKMALSFYLKHKVKEISINIPQKARCSVCGMFVSMHKDWAALVETDQSKKYYFDGVKDMIKFWFESKKYASIKQSEIKKIYVRDYYSSKFIDGRKAFYVTGSDMMGPMGKELIPFNKKSEAVVFKKDHQGVSIVGFNEITRKLLHSLD